MYQNTPCHKSMTTNGKVYDHCDLFGFSDLKRIHVGKKFTINDALSAENETRNISCTPTKQTDGRTTLKCRTLGKIGF